MASIKDLRKRIGSVKNTQQTTKAMKMVSAAYLRRAQDAITNQRPYAKKLSNLLQLMLSMPNLTVDSPLVKRPGEETEGGKKLLLLLVTSDRGLCGAFNGNIIRTALRWLAANQASYESVELGFVGKKGYDFYKTKKYNLGPYYQELGGKVSFQKAKKLGENVVERFLSGEVNEVKVIYNEFKNAVTQKTLVEDFLPLVPSAATDDAVAETSLYIVKPDASAVVSELLAKHFSIQAFRILLESQAGEHGARMSAMENATRNAGEMIKKLTLQYNKQRQASITKELLEIISGSESQKAS